MAAKELYIDAAEYSNDSLYSVIPRASEREERISRRKVWVCRISEKTADGRAWLKICCIIKMIRKTPVAGTQLASFCGKTPRRLAQSPIRCLCSAFGGCVLIDKINAGGQCYFAFV